MALADGVCPPDWWRICARAGHPADHRVRHRVCRLRGAAFRGRLLEEGQCGGRDAAIVVGTSARLIAHFVTPAAWGGLDTLLPPLLSATTFVVTCLLTQKTQESRHYVLTEAVQEGI
jgi:hypothetical protein